MFGKFKQILEPLHETTTAMTITVKELADRLSMHPSNFTKMGKSVSDVFEKEELIRFLESRRAPKGAWKAEKALLADRFWRELMGYELAPEPLPIKTENEPERKAITITPRLITAWLYIPAAAATIASVNNMHLIFYHITSGETFTAWVFTAVFAGSAFCFIASGSTWLPIQIVTWFTILFEAFCNLTGVYYGMLGKTGTPTRFLGMVTDIFNSGTHMTAICLGVFMALIIASVQIVSFKSIINHAIHNRSQAAQSA